MRVTPALLIALSLCAPLPLLAQEADQPGPAPADAPALPAISVIAATARPMTDRVIASGLIGPVEAVQVAPLIEGQPIEQLLADVGDQVAEGQVLAVLSKSTLELQRSQVLASLAAAKATIAQAEAQLIDADSAAAEAARVSERTAKLREQGSASQAAADTANAAAVDLAPAGCSGQTAPSASLPPPAPRRRTRARPLSGARSPPDPWASRSGGASAKRARHCRKTGSAWWAAAGRWRFWRPARRPAGLWPTSRARQ